MWQMQSRLSLQGYDILWSPINDEQNSSNNLDSSVFQLYLVFYSRRKILKANYFHGTLSDHSESLVISPNSHRGYGGSNQPLFYNPGLQLRLKKKDSAPSHEKKIRYI